MRSVGGMIHPEKRFKKVCLFFSSCVWSCFSMCVSVLVFLCMFSLYVFFFFHVSCIFFVCVFVLMFMCQRLSSSSPVFLVSSGVC